MRDYFYKASDILTIVHIVDTDGAFIDSSHVIEDLTLDHVEYRSETILAKNRDAMIERNARKQKNLRHLMKLHKLRIARKEIDYRVFFMSTNFDHVIADRQNNTEKEKINNAKNFAKRYSDNTEEFFRFFTQEAFSKFDDYSDSWDFIMQGTNSLNRFTNFGLILKALKTKGV